MIKYDPIGRDRRKLKYVIGKIRSGKFEQRDIKRIKGLTESIHFAIWERRPRSRRVREAILPIFEEACDTISGTDNSQYAENAITIVNERSRNLRANYLNGKTSNYFPEKLFSEKDMRQLAMAG